MTETAGLGTLFVSSFLAATLLPGGSEIVLAALLANGTVSLWPALAVATVGNTLGGLSSYLVGRLLPQRKTEAKAVDWMRRHGVPALLLSWVPFIGDALCVAAGWLRVNAWWCALCIGIGKFARYYVVARLVA